MQTAPMFSRTPVTPKWLAPWLFAGALFGYPLIAGLVSILQVDSRLLSIPLRLAVASAAVWLLLNSRVPALRAGPAVLFLIWAVYGARLVHDLVSTDVIDASYSLQFFVAGGLLPALALLSSGQWNQTRFARTSLIVAVAACVLAMLGTALGTFGEADLSEATGRLTTVALNPVSLGHLAVSAVLCVAVIWRSTAWSVRWVLILTTGLCLYTLLATGSKGPALALGLCLLVWSMRRLKTRWHLIALALPLAVTLALSGDSPLAVRIAASSEDLSTLDRIVLIDNSISQILASPVFGSASFELESGFYPHNVLLEAGMAMGIPLALVFTGLLAYGLRCAWTALASPAEDLLGLLYIQSLVEVMLSGAMFGATLTWVTLALLMRQRSLERRSVAFHSRTSGQQSRFMT